MPRLTRWLLGLFVFTIPFDQAFTLPGVGSLSRAVGLAVAAFGVLTVLSGDTVRLRRPSLFLLCATLFVAWSAMSVLWGIDRVASAMQAFTFVQLLVLAWLIWSFVDTSAGAGGLRWAYMLGTWFTIGTVVWNYLNQNPTVDPSRFTAFDTNANYTALNMVLAIPMAFDAAVHARGWARLPALLLVPASLYAISLTASRSAALSTVLVVIGCIVLIVRAKPVVKVVILTVLVAVVAAFATTLPERTLRRLAGTLTEVEGGDFSGRGWIWGAGVEAWLLDPALGAGAGNFNRAVVPTLGSARSAHNSFLALLVELGPLGPALFLLLFVVAFWPYATLLSGRAPPEARRYAALHTVLLLMLLLAQLPATWHYQRVTWFVLVAATLDHAVYLRLTRPVRARSAADAA